MFKPSDIATAIEAVNALSPLIGKVADYIGGHSEEMPPELPRELRSDVELRRLRVVAARQG